MFIRKLYRHKMSHKFARFEVIQIYNLFPQEGFLGKYHWLDDGYLERITTDSLSGFDSYFWKWAGQDVMIIH